MFVSQFFARLCPSGGQRKSEMVDDITGIVEHALFGEDKPMAGLFVSRWKRDLRKRLFV
jgi:hypothetical protein